MRKIPDLDNHSMKNFSLVMLETGTSTFATSIFTVLILWFAISVTKSPLITGFTSALMTAPLLFGVLAGAAVDQTRHKNAIAVMAAAIKTVSPATLLLIILFNNATGNIASLFLSAFTFGISITFLVPVRAVWQQNFLGKPVYLKGMSVAHLVSRTTRLSGYIAAAFIVPYSLEFSIFLVMALYIISLVSILLIPPVNVIRAATKKFSAVVKDGFTYIKNSRIITEIVIISAISNLFFGMSDSASTVLIGNVFHLSSSFLGYTFFAISGGGILGSVITAKAKQVNGVGGKLLILYVLNGTVVSLVALYPGIYMLISVFFVAGLLLGISSPIQTAALFGNVDRAKMGVVQGTMDTFGTSFSSVSGILAGTIMIITFPANVFFIMSGGFIALSITISMFKALRQVKV